MKVIETIQAADDEGNPIEFTKPVDIAHTVNDEMHAAYVVSQILHECRKRTFTTTTSIRIEL